MPNRYDNSDDETRYIGRVPNSGNQQPQGGQERPRQYFPGEYDPNQPQTQQYQDSYQGGYQDNYQGNYQQPVSDYEPPREKKSGSGLAGVLGALAVLALVAAGALFFLWRNAASEADKPAPEPVTETVTHTTQEPTTVTETETTTDSSGEGDSLRDRGRDLIPSEVPDDLLPENTEDMDVEGWLQDLFGEGGALENQ